MISRYRLFSSRPVTSLWARADAALALASKGTPVAADMLILELNKLKEALPATQTSQKEAIKEKVEQLKANQTIYDISTQSFK